MSRDPCLCYSTAIQPSIVSGYKCLCVVWAVRPARDPDSVEQILGAMRLSVGGRVNMMQGVGVRVSVR